MFVVRITLIRPNELQVALRIHYVFYVFKSLYYFYQLMQKDLLQWQQNYGVWNEWYQNLLYCCTISSNMHIVHVIFLFTRKRGWELITHMLLAHPLHPIRCRSQTVRQNLWIGWCVSSEVVVCILLYIQTMYYSCIQSNWNKFFIRLRYIYRWNVFKMTRPLGFSCFHSSGNL